MDLVRIVEEQIFRDFAHLRVNEFCHLRFFLVRVQVEIAGVEQRVCQVFPQLTCGLWVVMIFNQLAAPDAMAGEIFHHHHRQLRVVMVDFHGVLRAVPVVLDQRLRLQARTVQRQRPGLADAAHIRECLLNDDTAHALGIVNFENQIKVTVAHFLRLYQR